MMSMFILIIMLKFDFKFNLLFTKFWSHAETETFKL